MKYQKVVKAKFIERENRFIATVLLDDGTMQDAGAGAMQDAGGYAGRQVKVHVKNTGRCKELLVPGCTVYLEDFAGRMGTRKMQYSLVAVEKVCGTRTLLINMDSQAPNKVVQEALEQGRLMLPGFGVEGGSNGGLTSGRVSNLTGGKVSNLTGGTSLTYTLIRPETTHGDSRFDFYVEGAAEPGQLGDSAEPGQPDCAPAKAFIEVKGVTLEEDGFARFPDAPTERGLKHINGLIDAVAEGYRAYIIFVIQMKTIHTFGPNYDTQPEFGEALKRAKAAGVEILAFDCIVEPEGLQLDREVEIRLER